MTGDTASLWLFHSYQLSARRILEALRGGIQIGNSREPQNPATNPNQVVGLGGQGGRHAFLRVELDLKR
jgi:hypothetical protein